MIENEFHGMCVIQVSKLSQEDIKKWAKNSKLLTKRWNFHIYVAVMEISKMWI